MTEQEAVSVTFDDGLVITPCSARVLFTCPHFDVDHALTWSQMRMHQCYDKPSSTVMVPCARCGKPCGPFGPPRTVSLEPWKPPTNIVCCAGGTVVQFEGDS